MSEHDLLRDYIVKGTEDSFAELVSRYIDLVYSVALRQVRDAHAAQDVTQAVFVFLARKARSVGSSIKLAGWLLRTTRFVAANYRRREMHRVNRERQLSEFQGASESKAAWMEIAPVLDELLDQLNPVDRAAITLRFFERRSLAEIGTAFCISEDAAQKKVSRAIDKLRAAFSKRGISIAAAVFSTALAAQAVQAAPPDLASAISKSAFSTALPPKTSELVNSALSALRQHFLREVLLRFAPIAVLVAIIAFIMWRRSAEPPNISEPAATVAALVPVASELKPPRPPAPESEAAPASASLNLRIRVIDQVTGQPVPGALVDLSEIIAFPRTATNSFVTGLDGWAGIPLRGEAPTHWFIKLKIQKDGYVPKYVSWSEYQGDRFDDVPSEYVTQLAPGTAIGGRVINEHEEPVSNLRVVFSVVGPAPGSSKNRERLTMMGNYHTEVTAQDGSWSCDHVPAEFGMISFRLLHPRYQTARYQIAKLGHTAAPGQNIVIDADLRGGAAEMTVRSGIVIAGRVLDPAGAPVAGARVTLGREWSEPSRNQVTADDGIFRFSNAASNATLLTIQADRFAPAERQIVPGPASGDLTITLDPGVELAGRVVNKNGEPVPGARIRPTVDVSNRQRFSWSATADSAGRFRWKHAPLTEFYTVSAAGYDTQEKIALRAGADEQVIVMTNPATSGSVTFSGTVVDAQNQRPIPDFQVFLAAVEQMKEAPEHRTASTPELQVRGKAGVFGFDAPASALKYMIEIRAPDFAPFRYEILAPFDSSTHRNIELHAAAKIAGVLRLPDGKPAAGAVVVLCTVSDSLIGDFKEVRGTYMDMGGQFDLTATRGPHTIADHDGRFSFEPRFGATRVVAAHNAGFAEAALEELAAKEAMIVRPWGRVAGRLLVGGRPVAGEQVDISPWHWRFGTNAFVAAHLGATTDAAGNFEIHGVPQGEFAAYHRLGFRRGRPGDIPRSHGIYIRVQPGRTTSVTLGGSGRTVKGRVEPHLPKLKIDWRRDVHKLRAAKSNLDGTREFWFSPEGRAAQLNSRVYTLLFDDDGSFRIHDVEPGSYTLHFHFTAAGDSIGYREYEKSLVSFTSEVEIPPGEESFDLGVIRSAAKQ